MILPGPEALPFRKFVGNDGVHLGILVNLGYRHEQESLTPRRSWPTAIQAVS